MRLTRRGGLMMAGAAVATAGLPQSLLAQTGGTLHEVGMLNVSPDGTARYVFAPPVLQVAPGDTVKFLATDPGHNAQTYDDLIPEGAEGFRGRINEEIEVTLTTEGTYAYNCLPHQALGMVGLILVGDFTKNLAAVRDGLDTIRAPKSRERMADYLDEAEGMA